MNGRATAVSAVGVPLFSPTTVMVNGMILRLAMALVVVFPVAAQAQDTTIDLTVAIYPFLPDAESAAERLERSFEIFAHEKGLLIDLDIDLISTYDDDIKKIAKYDIAEIDLCMLDALREEGQLPLDEVPDLFRSTSIKWVGPADAAMRRQSAKYTLPHWVCGNFLIHWQCDEALKTASNFEQLLAALDPEQGRNLYADLWGGGTLGEYYADAVLDIHGAEEARKHLAELATCPAADVRKKLHSDAVLSLWRLTMEMPRQYRQKRKALHDLAFVYPRSFADEFDSCLIGYSERLHHLERRLKEEPWKSHSIPLPKEQLVIRQFPFGESSKGTPTWVDAFVIPKGKLSPKHNAIVLFFEFIMSDAGYRCFLEPREYYPSAYLLPAAEKTYESEFVRTQMPSLQLYRQCIDDSFPILDHELFRGIDIAGEQLKVLLSPASD